MVEQPPENLVKKKKKNSKNAPDCMTTAVSRIVARLNTPLYRETEKQEANSKLTV